MKKRLLSLLLILFVAATAYGFSNFFYAKIAATGYNDPIATYPLTLGAGESASIVICAGGATYATSNNAIKCVISRALNTIVLTKKVAGVETGLIDEAFTYSAGTNAIVIKDASNKVNVLYNGARVGTEQTVSDTSVIFQKRHYAEGGTGSFSVKRLRLGATVAEDAMDADNTGDWIAVDCGLAFDTDHYVLTETAYSQFITRQITGLTVGGVYQVGFSVQDGSATGRTCDIRVGTGPGTVEALDGDDFTTDGTMTEHSAYFIASATSLYTTLTTNIAAASGDTILVDAYSLKQVNP